MSSYFELTNLIRCKGTVYLALSPHSTKLASPNISWFLFELRALQRPHPFSARLGRWHSQEEMLWPSHRLVAGRLLPSLFLPCSTSMRKCLMVDVALRLTPFSLTQTSFIVPGRWSHRSCFGTHTRACCSNSAGMYEIWVCRCVYYASHRADLF